MSFAIEVRNLKKYFKSGIRGVLVQALDDMSFNVKAGSVFGLLGSNGAGKSTAIKIIMGLLSQNSGDVKIFGNSLNNDAKRRIGYLPEAPNFYKFLTSYELVLFYAELCGMPKKEAKKATEKTLEMVGLADAMNRRLIGYSKGMLQRTGLAQAIVHNPDLVILDEPSSGLDPVGMNDMTEMIRRLKEAGKTVLLCSHQLSEVEALCDDIVILHKGKVFAEGSLESILKKDGTKAIEVRNMSEDAIINAIKASGGELESLGDAKISLEEYFKIAVKGGLK